jgi:hypothetical protein
MRLASTPALVRSSHVISPGQGQGTTPPLPTPPTSPSPPAVPQVSGQVTPLTPPVVDVAGPSVDVLNAQLIGLRAQLRGFQDQTRVIRSELRHAKDPVERAQLMTRYADVQGQSAQIQGEIARVQADIATRQGVEAGRTSSTQTNSPMRGIDPDYVAGLMFAFIFAVAMPIALAYARRIWKGKPTAAPAPENPASAQRLERMEQAIDSIAIEVERISEAQRFVTKVMVERAPSQASSDAGGNGASSLGEGQPIRALGAGAMPIETVKKSDKLRV